MCRACPSPAPIPTQPPLPKPKGRRRRPQPAPPLLPAGAERAGERWAGSFAGFDHPATAPLIQLGPNLWLQELFHGPTLAFKDFALQMVARLLDGVLAKRGRTATILAATSGGCPCSCQ